MSRVLVCGGRHFTDRRLVVSVLAAQHKHSPISCLINGGCSGADTLAAEWAKANGIAVETYKADWAIGPAAGPQRNQRMLEAKPDLVIAFQGGKGTADMVSRAKAAGVAVKFECRLIAA